MLSEKAKQARREYKRKYHRAHSDKINAYQKEWRKANPDKVRAYQENYWQRKASEASA